MKRNIVWTLFFVATLLLSLASVASAQDRYICSNAGVAGTWGTTLTGTQFLPTGPVPFASVNRNTFDHAGNFSGTQTRSTNGNVSRVTFQGTYTVNPDCTGKKTAKAFDPSGNLLNTVEADFVLVNNGKELLEIFTSVTVPTPNGPTSVPVVITGHAIKLFPFPWLYGFEQ
ncbi:MAG: hypothetical protein LAO31_12985 [Acidobacteriia bacterium]|nr:hypothetical protein [Terriglobia bacterium]